MGGKELTSLTMHHLHAMHRRPLSPLQKFHFRMRCYSAGNHKREYAPLSTAMLWYAFRSFSCVQSTGPAFYPLAYHCHARENAELPLFPSAAFRFSLSLCTPIHFLAHKQMKRIWFVTMSLKTKRRYYWSWDPRYLKIWL